MKDRDVAKRWSHPGCHQDNPHSGLDFIFGGFFLRWKTLRNDLFPRTDGNSIRYRGVAATLAYHLFCCDIEARHTTRMPGFKLAFSSVKSSPNTRRYGLMNRANLYFFHSLRRQSRKSLSLIIATFTNYTTLLPLANFRRLSLQFFLFVTLFSSRHKISQIV